MGDKLPATELQVKEGVVYIGVLNGEQISVLLPQ